METVLEREDCLYRYIEMPKNLDGSGKNRRSIAYFPNEQGCWVCRSHSTSGKGGPPQFNGKSIVRRLYEDRYGAIPKGLVVRHKCDNPLCINVDHVEIGTHQDNVDDAFRRGRRSHQNGTPMTE